MYNKDARKEFNELPGLGWMKTKQIAKRRRNKNNISNSNSNSGNTSTKYEL